VQMSCKDAPSCIAAVTFCKATDQSSGFCPSSWLCCTYTVCTRGFPLSTIPFEANKPIVLFTVWVHCCVAHCKHTHTRAHTHTHARTHARTHTHKHTQANTHTVCTRATPLPMVPPEGFKMNVDTFVLPLSICKRSNGQVSDYLARSKMIKCNGMALCVRTPLIKRAT